MRSRPNLHDRASFARAVALVALGTLAAPLGAAARGPAPRAPASKSQAPAAKAPRPAAAPARKPPRSFVNSIGMELVEIPAGSFWMGTDSDRVSGDRPRHRVEITRPFFIGKHEVTQEQWFAVMGRLPLADKPGRKLPVTMVSWDDVQAFLTALNNRESAVGQYRLPTEAEWEYAARAGADTPWPFGDDPALLSSHAWSLANGQGRLQEVGKLAPNAWGLHDMLGNVAEWVQDYFDEKTFRGAGPLRDPRGPEELDPDWPRKGFRGGSVLDDEQYVNPANRNGLGLAPSYELGFRVVSATPPAAAVTGGGGALPTFEVLVAQGDPVAQLRMGYATEYGAPGIPKDPAAAAAWYRKAAEQGNGLAQFEVGRCYASGLGVAKDPAQAFEWYRRSAEQGFSWAQNEVGYRYRHGVGVAVDKVEGARWLRAAAEQGYAPAQASVGYLFDVGDGVAPDLKRAFAWYRRAAQQGNATGQLNLGVCYRDGRGVQKDEKAAVEWFRKAAAQGHEKAKRALAELGQ